MTTKKLDLTKPLRFVLAGRDYPVRVLASDARGKYPLVVAYEYDKESETICRVALDGTFGDSGEVWIANAVERKSTFFAFYKHYNDGCPYLLGGTNEGYNTLEKAIEQNSNSNGGNVCPIIEILTEDGVVVDGKLHLGKGNLA